MVLDEQEPDRQKGAEGIDLLFVLLLELWLWK